MHFFLLLLIFTSSCNGQDQLSVPKDSISTPKTIFIDQPKTKPNMGFTTIYPAGEAPITCGLQDKEGNLWFGAKKGELWRYDGKTLTDFTKKIH